MTEYTPQFGESSLGVIFQGQNVNSPGMGKLLNKFEAAREVYDLAEEVLGYDVRKVCFGSLTHLQEEPEYVQPAIVTTELAELRACEDLNDGLNIDLVTGLSLGMYAALAATKSAEDATVIDISAKRAAIIARNARKRPGGMLSVKGLPHQEALDDLIQKTKTGVAIWWGSHGLVTLSGTRSRIRKAHLIASSIEGVKAEVSKVKEGAHGKIQERTQMPLTRVLEGAGLVIPELPLLSNDPRKDETVFLRTVPEIIKHYSDQMVEPVDMGEVTKEFVLSGIAKALEFGPDRSFGLSGQIIRRSREEEIRAIREAMGRDVVRKVTFDYESLLI